MQIDEALDLYFRHTQKLRSARGLQQMLRKHLLPQLAGRPLTDIRRRDMVTVVETTALSGVSNGHHVFANSRAFFNWCCSKDWIDNSPCDRLSAARLLGPPGIRQRVLADEELMRIWKAAGLLASFSPFGTIVRLLILTAQRRGEVARMRWDELSGLDDPARSLWTIDATRYKTAVTHRIPLSAAAVAELQRLERREGGELVFPSRRLASTRPFSGFGKLKERLDGLSGVEDWCFHDLRRTARTGMASLGVPENVAELCLGHGRKGMSRVYNQHRYEGEMREAFEQWSAKVASLEKPA